MQLAHCAVETIISESIHIELPWLLSLLCEMGKRESEASAEYSKKKTRKCNKPEREAISHSLQAIIIERC